ncbi:hypothetical protein CH063_06351, partial [Colletotrichum higginsianum]
MTEKDLRQGTCRLSSRESGWLTQDRSTEGKFADLVPPCRDHDCSVEIVQWCRRTRSLMCTELRLLRPRAGGTLPRPYIVYCEVNLPLRRGARASGCQISNAARLGYGGSFISLMFLPRARSTLFCCTGTGTYFLSDIERLGQRTQRASLGREREKDEARRLAMHGHFRLIFFGSSPLHNWVERKRERKRESVCFFGRSNHMESLPMLRLRFIDCLEKRCSLGCCWVRGYVRSSVIGRSPIPQ